MRYRQSWLPSDPHEGLPRSLRDSLTPSCLVRCGLQKNLDTTKDTSHNDVKGVLAQQESMKKICEMVTNLLHVPYYLVPLLPCKDLSVQKHMVMSWRPPLRPSILELAERLESSKGWALERTFGAWLNRQPWRKCLPPIYEFKSQFFRVLTHGM